MYINGSNVILLREQPRVSEVLEETFHAKQDRANRFGVLDLQGVISIKREIEAQKYLLSVKDKYKIPEEETDLTLRNLKEYQAQLKNLTGEEDI